MKELENKMMKKGLSPLELVALIVLVLSVFSILFFIPHKEPEEKFSVTLNSCHNETTSHWESKVVNTYTGKGSFYFWNNLTRGNSLSCAYVKGGSNFEQSWTCQELKVYNITKIEVVCSSEPVDEICIKQDVQVVNDECLEGCYVLDEECIPVSSLSRSWLDARVTDRTCECVEAEGKKTLIAKDVSPCFGNAKCDVYRQECSVWSCGEHEVEVMK